jgi:hypothetical protein
MSITTDLEKLASLRDQGDLSQAEFEKAKERLLSEDAIEGSQIREEDAPPLPKKGGEEKPERYLLIAVLSTIAAAFATGSAIIAPSPISLLVFGLFAVAATLNWIELSKQRGRK